MADALKLVQGLIEKVQHAPAAAAAEHASNANDYSDLKSDYAWEPLVPPGHTSFSWTGQAKTYPNWTPLVDHQGIKLKVESDAKAGKRRASTASNEERSKESAPPAAAVASTSGDKDVDLFSKLDVRVGTIVEAAKHPDADALYLEKIDIGEAEPRQVISGLVAHVPLDQFLNSKVLLITNLKPSKLRGQDSFGMVFCAATADKSKVELIRPPANSKNGERVTLAGVSSLGAPEASINPKAKKDNVWESALALLKTDGKAVATFNGKALITSGGECKAASLANTNIS